VLPKENRLSKKEIRQVFKRGKVIYGDLFLLKVCLNSLNLSRFSIIVPKKVAKKATQRNRIKRLARESLRKKLPKIKPGFDGVFIATSKILEKDYWEIDEEIEKLLNKAGIKTRL
jgi:ribonuclease P protein component